MPRIENHRDIEDPVPAARATVSAVSLTLEQAWQRAEQANPALRTAEANLATVAGEFRDASALLWNNPQLTAAGMRREVPQPATPTQINREWSLGLSQTFEIAGQKGARRSAAEQSLAATQAVIAETWRQLRAEVESDAIASSIIGMVHKLGLRVVAEGVEMEEQLVYLHSQDCDLMQGYTSAGP